eukprot:Blabericola_migrator_1__5575@NODE_2839_length_2296_cov_30_711978_g1781_i0_p3_GENE_NODE_2839_length_2296_cov_30_711978_g1781_i0NODE_2839_length_2296_cov_30_711978_g1781_i0_p3_ORF_typecomplete_len179_score34_84Mog1/PF04603_12/4e24_NODE_2839_length_2296_cov_30_711978_g1781_i016812217
MFKQVECFGGAIKLQVPSDLRDESDYRPIPDNQEVFYNPQTKVSIILDIMELARNPAETSFASFHWLELMAECRSPNVQITKDLTVTPALCPEIHERLSNEPLAVGYQIGFCEGYQKILDIDSCLSLVVIRLPKIQTDVVLQLNVPTPQPDEALSNAFLATLKSFEIRDWQLFGSSPN